MYTVTFETNCRHFEKRFTDDQWLAAYQEYEFLLTINDTDAVSMRHLDTGTSQEKSVSDFQNLLLGDRKGGRHEELEN